MEKCKNPENPENPESNKLELKCVTSATKWQISTHPCKRIVST
jgi:hypothetical protein